MLASHLGRWMPLMSIGSPPNITPASKRLKRRGVQRCRALFFCLAFVFATFFASTCGCTDTTTDSQNVPQSVMRRVTAPMAHDGGWRETRRVVVGNDIYVRYDRPGEYAWFRTRDLMTLPWEGEVPE